MSGFRTKLDYSNNRQIKQFEKTNTILSGGTVFGLPFSGLTVGPNLDYSGVTNSYLYGLSTFSGNNTTTIFNWFDTNMQIAEYAVTAITPTTSADTQELEYIFVGNNQSTLDGNTFYVDYSGISFDIHVNYMIDLGGGNYSGTVEHSYIDFLSATSLDYQSRTIWIDNPEITRTDRLIITRNPQVNYVWTCIDSEGMGAWMPSSGSSTGSSANLVWTAGTNNSTAVLSGSTSVASGQYSVAEGQGTIASGYASHAEGDGSVASGTYGSHAEGYQTTSSGYSSHAEGSQTTASGNYSHAEGSNTTASGYYSHAEGYYTIAKGDGSHVEGSQTTAISSNSHAEGNGNVSGWIGFDVSTVVNGLITLNSSLGDVTSEFTGTDVILDYKIYSYNSVTFNSTNTEILLDDTSVNGGNYVADLTNLNSQYGSLVIGMSTHSEGYDTKSLNNFSHSEGSGTIASGSRSHAEGQGTTASGYASHAEGRDTKALGLHSHAEGYATTASNYYSHAEGKQTKASGLGSHAEGGYTTASNFYSHTEGYMTTASGEYSHAQGFNTIASGNSGSHAEGRYTTASGMGSHAEGKFTTASGNYSHAEGDTSKSSGNYSHSEGRFTSAGGIGSHVEGYGCVTGYYSEGYYISDGNYSHAEGYNTTASGNYSHSEGLLTSASGYASHAEGVNTITSGDISHAEGYYTTASGDYSHAEGYYTTASGFGSHVGGINSSSNSPSSFIHSNGSTIYSNSDNSVILGGLINTISGHTNSAIIAGTNNLIDVSGFNLLNTNESIFAGSNNTIKSSQNSSIIGGDSGYITYSPFSILAGGYNNSIGYSATTSSGYAYVTSSGIFAGDNNKIYANYANVNTNEYLSNTIIGGSNNELDADSTDYSSIISGQYNKIYNSAYASVLLGGQYNELNSGANFSTLIGGAENKIQSADYATILGGSQNTITGTSVFSDYSTIIGGTNHLLRQAQSSVILGGTNHILLGFSRSVILGGDSLRVFSEDSTYTPNLSVSYQNGSYASMFGVNTAEPESTIDAYGSNSSRLQYDGLSAGGQILLSGATELPRFTVISNSGTTSAVGETSAISLGVRSWDDVTYTIYGKKGDAFIYGGIYTNGINIISNDGGVSSGEDYIRFFAGQSQGSNDGANTADIHIQGSGSTRGNVGFSTNTPTQKIDVNGNGRFRVIGSSASAGALHYTSDGTLTTNTSDGRLKINVNKITNALEKVNQLRGVTYNWKEEPNGKLRIGFIAQELNDVVPELTFINTNTEEQYMGVHYDNMTALLLEAIKELSSGITYNNISINTQTIVAEDNNIELNFNGNKESSIGGGLIVLNTKGENLNSKLVTDENGDFVTNTDFKPSSLTIPRYTPTSSQDNYGSEGNITRDDEYLYIKNSTGWMRTKLETF